MVIKSRGQASGRNSCKAGLAGCTSSQIYLYLFSDFLTKDMQTFVDISGNVMGLNCEKKMFAFKGIGS